MSSTEGMGEWRVGPEALGGTQTTTRRDGRQTPLPAPTSKVTRPPPPGPCSTPTADEITASHPPLLLLGRRLHLLLGPPGGKALGDPSPLSPFSFCSDSPAGAPSPTAGTSPGADPHFYTTQYCYYGLEPYNGSTATAYHVELTLNFE